MAGRLTEGASLTGGDVSRGRWRRWTAHSSFCSSKMTPSKANHLAQHAGVRAFRRKLPQGSLLLGHRGVLRSELRFATSTLPQLSAVAACYTTSGDTARKET